MASDLPNNSKNLLTTCESSTPRNFAIKVNICLPVKKKFNASIWGQ